MFRTAILFITVALLVMFINSWLKLRALKPPAKKASPKRIDQEPMVQCEECGLHIPKTRAVEANGHRFCSQKHQQAHVKRLSGK